MPTCERRMQQREEVKKAGGVVASAHCYLTPSANVGNDKSEAGWSHFMLIWRDREEVIAAKVMITSKTVIFDYP